MAKTKQDLPAPVVIIKNFCKLLSEHSVKEITATYDGSGDSGSLDIMVRHKVDADVVRNPGFGRPAVDNGYAWANFNSFIPLAMKTNALITKERVDEFEEAFYELLPGGWEINDGSYGEINIDFETLSVHIEHNERYTEVNTTTAEY